MCLRAGVEMLKTSTTTPTKRRYFMTVLSEPRGSVIWLWRRANLRARLISTIVFGQRLKPSSMKWKAWRHLLFRDATKTLLPVSGIERLRRSLHIRVIKKAYQIRRAESHQFMLTAAVMQPPPFPQAAGRQHIQIQVTKPTAV